MRFIIITFISSIYFPYLSLCQTSAPFGSLSSSQSVREEFGIATQNKIQNAYTFSNRYRGVQGHPFLENSWTSGLICLNPDSVIVNDPKVKLKFDAYNNELWILNKTDSMIAYSKDIHWFSLKMDEKEEIFLKFPKNSKNEPQKFYNTVFHGSHVVLVHDLKKELKRADFIDKGMYTSGSPYDRFEEEYKFYFAFKNDEFKKVKLNAGSLIDLLPKKYQKNVKNFCKQNKISGKLDENQAVSLLTHFESLMKSDAQ